MRQQGTVEIAKEKVGAAGWESIVETLCQDLRFAARTLRKTPVFTSSCAWSTSSTVSGDLHLSLEEFSSGILWLRERRMRANRIGLQV